MIEFQNHKGKRVFINPKYIGYIQEKTDDTTIIHFTNIFAVGYMNVIVKENIKSVMQKLDLYKE